MTKVIAKIAGFYEAFREPGDVFEVDGDIPPWAEAAEADEALTLPERSTPLDPDVSAAPGNPPTMQPASSSARPQYQVESDPYVADGVDTSDAKLYSIKHNGAGTYIVIDKNGDQVGDSYPNTGTSGEAKAAAQAEADRLNAGGAAETPSATETETQQATEMPASTTAADASQSASTDASATILGSQAAEQGTNLPDA